MLKRLIPLALCGPLIFALSASPAGAQAPEDCTISHHLVEGVHDSDEVRCLQTKLNTLGIDSGPVDGWFGPVTEEAVTAFQQLSMVPADGVVTAELATTLGIWNAAEATAQAVRGERIQLEPPPPPPDLSRGQCSEWYNTAMAAGFSDGQWNTVDRIMYRESRCQPGARNPSGASGLMQIMPMWADDCGGSRSDLFDPSFNLQCARHILAVQGWGAWSTY